MITALTVYVEGKSFGPYDNWLQAAERWDQETFNLGRSAAGGITIQEFQPNNDGGRTMVRDGWLLQVHEDGTTYVHPRALILRDDNNRGVRTA